VKAWREECSLYCASSAGPRGSELVVKHTRAHANGTYPLLSVMCCGCFVAFRSLGRSASVSSLSRLNCCRSNELGPEGGTAVAEALSSLPCLATLNLG
jgi:hypothetical protein